MWQTDVQAYKSTLPTLINARKAEKGGASWDESVWAKVTWKPLKKKLLTEKEVCGSGRIPSLEDWLAAACSESVLGIPIWP